MPTAPAVPPQRHDAAEPPPSADIRSSRLYLLSRGNLATVMRRVVSVVSLVALDVLGLALGIYLALVLRSFLYGKPVYWSLLWRDGPAEWLKFLAPVCVLVFWQAGLYAQRERRSGPGSDRLVARAARSHRARLRDRHELRLHDDGPDPDRGRHECSCDRVASRRLRVALTRAACVPPACDGGSCSPGRGRACAACGASSGRRAWASPTSSSASSRTPASASLPVARHLARRHSGGARAAAPGRADPGRVRLRRASGAGSRRTGPPPGCACTARARYDRSSRAEGGVRAGYRCAALRAASRRS